MNPVLEVIEQGHFQKSVSGGKGHPDKLICRLCADEMPCTPILEARAKVRRQYGTLRIAKQPKVA